MQIFAYLDVASRENVFLTLAPTDADEQRIQETVRTKVNKDELGAANPLPGRHHYTFRSSLIAESA